MFLFQICNFKSTKRSNKQKNNWMETILQIYGNFESFIKFTARIIVNFL